MISASLLAGVSVIVSTSCGGGGGSQGTAQDSGANKTTLTVQASDVDSDTLHYQWRVTAGTIENRDARQTVWTMPDGPGLHFAYVVVSDGKGGYAEQQYAVSSDALGTNVSPKAAVAMATPQLDLTKTSAARLRFQLQQLRNFTAYDGSSTGSRRVYLPDVQVQVFDGVGAVAFSGTTDTSGELTIPPLPLASSYTMRWATAGGPLISPDKAVGLSLASVDTIKNQFIEPDASRNLLVHGHVEMADGSFCGMQSEFHGIQSSATAQVLDSQGGAASPVVRVNRYGDYAIDAAVLSKGSYKVRIACEAMAVTVDVPPSGNALGYVGGTSIAIAPQKLANSRPLITKMVANGPDGNVRGAVVEPDPGISSTMLGANRFLSFKGGDTRMSACQYYWSIGATSGCDAQGGLKNPITLDDWKRQHKLSPFTSGNTEWSAVYINRMDLNLVRRMYATKSDNSIAFYVCNHPGPVSDSQTEVDQVISIGLADEKRVACVAMEWSATPGVNANQPFTKFLTFGPDGSLIPSINLDGRGEKFMPGACVACHGGSSYNGGFTPDRNTRSQALSPYVGSRFLPFDTGNYLFGSTSALSELSQREALYQLNRLVQATEAKSLTDTVTPDTALSHLIDGWYQSSHSLNKDYVPDAWLNAGPDSVLFYRKVIGGVCRTCHVAMGPNFDWDSAVSKVTGPLGNQHFCGGTSELALNASMPDALISRDRLADRIGSSTALSAAMQRYLGCLTPKPDPVYARP